MVKDPTMQNIILVLGALVTFIFTVLTFAFGGDIALYTMAVKNDIFWESEYGYSDWDSDTEEGTNQTMYHEEAETLEDESINSIMNAVSAVGIAGSLITLILIALVFFRKEGGIIYMFRNVDTK
ncbi:MAG: hypothetical protein ACOC56_04835 [Atribacterota bacterium]